MYIAKSGKYFFENSKCSVFLLVFLRFAMI